jgi:hypothetical protein
MKIFEVAPKLRIYALLAVFFLPAGGLLHAQVLATGETGGKASKALLLTANGLFPEGLNLFSPYAQFIYGLNPRTDFLVSAGTISALGRTQSFIGGGALIQLLKRDRFLVDIASFHLFSTPLNKRDEACHVLYNTAVIASHPVTIAGKPVTVYSGVNFLIPIGSAADKLFTPPDLQINVPIGFSTNLTKKWVFMAEYDAGPDLKSAGIGLLRLF